MKDLTPKRADAVRGGIDGDTVKTDKPKKIRAGVDI